MRQVDKITKNFISQVNDKIQKDDCYFDQLEKCLSDSNDQIAEKIGIDMK